MMSACAIVVSALARFFMILPYFGPNFLKSGFTRFTSTPSSLPTSFISFTFTSLSTSPLTAFIVSSGIMIVFSG